MVEERKVKHVYKTTDNVFKIVQIFKIHSGIKIYDECLDALISLGWQKYKEIEENEQKENIL